MFKIISMVAGDHSKGHWGECAFFFVLFLAYELALFAVGSLFVYWQMDGFEWSGFAQRIFHWDAAHVMKTARMGYESTDPNHYRVFPLVPFLIHCVKSMGWSFESAALVVSQLSALVSFFFLYKLALLNESRRVAFVSLLLFALYPTAYFLSIPYMEAAFCATTFAAIYFSKREKYVLAFLFAALASLSRIPGVFMIAVCALYVICSYARSRQIPWKPLLSLSLGAALGFALVLLIFKATYSDWFFFLHYREKNWGANFTWPFSALKFASQIENYPSDQKITVVIFPILAIFGSLVSLPLIWKKIDLFDRAFLIVHLGILLCVGFWVSHPRLLLPLYPLYLGLAAITKESRLKSGGLILLFGTFMLFFWDYFLRGFWAF